MPQVMTPDYVRAADRLRELLAKHREVEMLLQIGEYQPGGNPLADEAIRKIDAIRAFFNRRRMNWPRRRTPRRGFSNWRTVDTMSTTHSRETTRRRVAALN